MLMTDMTAEQYATAVLADFREWSGGYHPSEASADEIQTYVNHYADAWGGEDRLDTFLTEEATK